MFLTCHVTSQDPLIGESSDFMSDSSSFYVTILSIFYDLLIFHVISQEHTAQGSYDFKRLLSLVTSSIVLVEKYCFQFIL